MGVRLADVIQPWNSIQLHYPLTHSSHSEDMPMLVNEDFGWSVLYTARRSNYQKSQQQHCFHTRRAVHRKSRPKCSRPSWDLSNRVHLHSVGKHLQICIQQLDAVQLCQWRLSHHSQHLPDDNRPWMAISPTQTTVVQTDDAVSDHLLLHTSTCDWICQHLRDLNSCWRHTIYNIYAQLSDQRPHAHIYCVLLPKELPQLLLLPHACGSGL